MEIKQIKDCTNCEVTNCSIKQGAGFFCSNWRPLANKRVYTSAEVKEITGLTMQTVLYHARKLNLPQFGKSYIFDDEAIAYINSKKGQTGFVAGEPWKLRKPRYCTDCEHLDNNRVCTLEQKRIPPQSRCSTCPQWCPLRNKNKAKP